jgi:hypothetical protein
LKIAYLVRPAKFEGAAYTEKVRGTGREEWREKIGVYV